jgi:hypothetical protein
LSSSSSSFVAVGIHDPIPGHDRFGQLMIENLKRAGIAGGGGGGSGGGTTNTDTMTGRNGS